jgi:anti-sigma regulatory factor (Ser/Thr protein kinase)
MPDTRQKTILAECPAEEFVGRRDELDRIINYASSDAVSGPLTLVGPPGSGVSELLRHSYDRLFHEQTAIIPFYFALSKSDKTARQTAQRFLHQFLLQTVAFRRRDASILAWYPDISELAELAVPADGHWFDRLVEANTRDRADNDDQTYIQTCITAPVRAAASGARVFVMIDDCHVAARFDEMAELFGTIKDVYRGSSVSYILAGRRRFSFGESTGERLVLDRLSFAEAALLVEKNAARFDVKINDQTRDLIARQFGGNPAFIRFIFQAADEKNDHLENFLNVQKIYTQEIFGGRIRVHYDAVIKDIAPTEDLQKGILSLADVSLTLGNKQLSVDAWRKRLAISEPAFTQTLDLLNIDELIRMSGNGVEVMDCNEVLTDYITARFRLEVIGDNRAALFGESVAAYLKRAPRLMARLYRHNASLGLRELLASFSLQDIPLAVIDYGVYAERYKGLNEDEITAGLAADSERVSLPQIVYTANAADLYKPIGELIEKERSVVAIGFQEGRYTDDDEIVWVVAEIDSKLEASRELTEFWCDRLEMVALMCNFHNYKVWLIAPEGFSPEAMEMLRERNAFGSSRRQAELLKHVLGSKVSVSRPPVEEYEVTVPMDGENELIAAHTLEEIAKRHHIAPKAVSQIKTALLEASINASEHSLSPDRRIHQKFSVEDDRIVITITNRGLRLTDRRTKQIEPESERRGWGLKLIEKLMDEVKVHQSDDGTSISMTKYLTKEVLA